MGATADPYEVVRLIIASIAVGFCLSNLLDALADRRAVLATGTNGIVRYWAVGSVVGETVSVLIGLALMGAAALSLALPPVADTSLYNGARLVMLGLAYLGFLCLAIHGQVMRRGMRTHRPAPEWDGQERRRMQ